MMWMSMVAALAASLPMLGLVEGAPTANSVPRQPSRIMKREVVKRNAELVTGLGGVNFKIGQVENPNFQMTEARGPIALAQAYRKYSSSIPPELQALIPELLGRLTGSPLAPGGGVGGASPGQGAPGDGNPNNMPIANETTPSAAPQGPTDPGEVTAVPGQFDRQYLCEVQIGTPPQTLVLNFDTGSSDFWVFTSETPPNLLGGQTPFDIGASSTAEQVPGASWDIRYGDGSFTSGDVYRDVVTIGDVTVQSQAINSASEISDKLAENADQDGLVGLALSSINTVQPVQEKTFFDNAMADLAMPLFTANLKRQEPGSYTFGAIDESEFEGDLTFVAANTSMGFWGVTVDGISIGGSGGTATAPAAAAAASPMGPYNAIVDTGSTLLLISDEVADAYYASVPGAKFNEQAGGYLFDCNSQLPSLIFTIGEAQLEVPGELINLAPIDMLGSGCFGGVQRRVAGVPFDILGDVFLKAVFTVFHGGDLELGFAPKPI